MSRGRYVLFSLVCFVIMVTLTGADVIYVDDDVNDGNGTSWETAFATINEAVTAASDGDEIRVATGTYYENINLAKHVEIYGSDPCDWDIVSETIVDGNGATDTFKMGFGRSVGVSGLTITGGTYGVYPTSTSSAFIKNCIVKDNGTGLKIVGCNAAVSNCIIKDNTNEGIYVGGASLAVKNSIVKGNDTGVMVNSYCGATLSNCTIVDNVSYGVKKTSQYCSADISNCILWGNGDDLYDCSATYSCIEDCNDAAGVGNICGDANNPRFAEDEHYCLQIGSPCVDIGSDGNYEDQTDIEGLPRLADINDRGDDINDVDMGATELNLDRGILSGTVAKETTSSNLTVTDIDSGSITANDLAQILMGNLPGVTISNVVYTGDDRAAGSFSGGGTEMVIEVGIENGVVLGSGKVVDAIGPNIRPKTSTRYYLAGDNDLAAMIPVDPADTNDAAVLEFDFTTSADTIYTRYVFSSEEYDKYVGKFDDCFGCFINSVQCALLPDEVTYIGVGTVNSSTNSEFYRNNILYCYIDCEMNGLTTVLTLERTINQAPATNHIKIAIVDLNDAQLDSNVFIESFSDEPPPYVPIVWHVDENVTAPLEDRNGRSWATAFKCLQDALCNPLLQPSDKIWVAKGTYKPDQAEIAPINSGDQTATFQLVDKVQLKGGYAGSNNLLTPYEWDMAQYPTILSGDINGDETLNGNSYHVVTGSNTDSATLLSSFIITAGNAQGGGIDNAGGGMYNNMGSPSIEKCIFYNNKAYEGGAMLNDQGSSPIIINCIFSNNCSHGRGIVVYNSGGSSPEFINCTSSGNPGSDPKIYNYESGPKITNCIFWNDGNEISDQGTPSSIVTYSNIKGGWPTGTGNIGGNPEDEPIFLDADDPAGEDGVFATGDDGLVILYPSPGVDVANGDIAPDTDLLGVERQDILDIPNGDVGTPGYVDMGAYELKLRTWYVNNSKNGDGSSWQDAFRYLQDALAHARPGEEILVAGSTKGRIYHPDQDIEHHIEYPDGTGDRTATFQLVDKVRLKGGYYGNGDTRDIVRYRTILSGDLNDNDNNDDNDGVPPDFDNHDENSSHVITAIETDASTLLEGFIIMGGNADGQDIPDGCGGGMLLMDGEATVKKCVFESNRTDEWGGALSILTGSSSPKFIDCVFNGNSADGVSGDNLTGSGGAVHILYGYTEFINCIFSDNYANKEGGAIAQMYSNSRIINCTFSENYSGYDGVGCGAAVYCYLDEAEITNCIIWNDHSLGDYETICVVTTSGGPEPTVTYCDVFEGYAGTGNINSDPSFIHEGRYREAPWHPYPYFHYPKGPDGKFFTSDDGLQIKSGSPCVGAANDGVAPDYDILDVERSDSDMGAYEYTP